MHSCVYFVLVVGPLIQVMSRHRGESAVPSVASQPYPANQWRRSFLMKLDLGVHESNALLQVPVTSKLTNYKTTSHQTAEEYHDKIQQPANVLKTFYGTTCTEGVCHINGPALGSQTTSGIVMDASRTLLNGTRLMCRVHNMDHVFVKLAFTLFVHLLLRKNISLELHLLYTALFHWRTSSATLTPTPSYSLYSTPSLSSSFQSTISSDNQPLSRTFNATILSSKNHTSSSTAYIQIDKPVTKTTDLKRLQGTCEEHWIQYGDLCYRVVLETRIFNHAERFCVINSAHLTSITSQEENDRVFDLVNKYIGQSGRRSIWLGMERLHADSRLHWVDDQSLSYQNWAPGEPDSTGACVQMIRKGWWEDTSCSEKLPYICKKEQNIGLPYSRATELGILIGIPLACSAIMLCIVAFLLVKSVQDSDGTYFAFGKHRDKDKIHSCLINMTASIAHVGALGYVNDRRYTVSSMKSMSSTHSAANSRSPSRVNSIVDPPEIKITPETPEQGRKHDARVFASSSTSIEQERFQSTTSLDNLLSKKRIKPKSRRMRSLRKADAVVSPGGTMGRYKRKTKQFGDSEA